MFAHLKTGLVAAAMTIGLTVMAQAATVNVNGSTTVASNILTPHKAAIEKASGQSLNITANGTGRGIADLMAEADTLMYEHKKQRREEGDSEPATTPGKRSVA